jgi:hypothetical protein
LLLEATEEIVVPAPALVEFDWLASTRINPGVFPAFLQDVLNGAYRVEDLEVQDYVRIRQIMQQYADFDIGFVDAAVLAIVERLGEPKLATLDRRHFGVMKPRHVLSLQLLPDLSA